MLEDCFISQESGKHLWSNIEGTKFTAADLEKLSTELHLSEKERTSVEHLIALLHRLDTAHDSDRLSARAEISGNKS
jgi:hypothetical protein